MDAGASSGASKDEEAGCGDFDGGHCFAHLQDEVQFCKDETRFGDLECMGKYTRGLCRRRCRPPDDGENEGLIGEVVE